MSITFRRRQKHDLKGLLKELESETDTAILALKQCMASSDEKIKFNAAIKVIELRKEVSELINTDEIQRMLLESKNPERTKQLTTDEEDDNPAVGYEIVEP